MNDRTRALSDAGVSIWLDDLSRTRLTSGNLAELVAERDVVGVTTNPSIFAAALSQGDAYTEQIRDLKAKGTDVEDVITALTTDDVRDACDLFMPIYERTKGFDGRVSIEVDPRHAHDGAATVEQAKALYGLVDRPNVLVKIPATSEGLAAITETIAEGISVNVTLIFSVERYSAVFDAYLTGLERALEQGVDIANVHSVASIFISRVDSEVDKRLGEIGATALQGQAAIALAGLCHEVYTNVLASDRWQRLEAAGANPQRPLWASTSTKNPEFRDVIYVEGLITPGVVNTMPEKTLQAFADHGEVSGDVMTGAHAQAHATFDALKAAGVDMPDVVEVLETEGVKKFIDPWVELIATMGDQISKA